MVLTDNEMRQKISKIQQDVLESNLINDNKDKYIKMKGSTLKALLDMNYSTLKGTEKIKRLSDEKDLEITVKSGIAFGDHTDEDWVIFTHNPVPLLDPEWLDDFLAHEYETEREVETYFAIPLLDKLGYDYEDIVIGYPFKISVGKKELKAEADVVVFNGHRLNENRERDMNDVLLIVEAKSTDTDISRFRHQPKAYAKELFPARYILTNGKMISVFAFNGMKTQDSEIMSFDKSMLLDVWKDLYRCCSKKATISEKKR